MISKIDDRAQLSFEMIILLAAVAAIAFLILSNLNTKARDATTKLGSKSDEVLSLIDDIAQT